MIKPFLKEIHVSNECNLIQPSINYPTGVFCTCIYTQQEWKLCTAYISRILMYRIGFFFNSLLSICINIYEINSAYKKSLFCNTPRDLYIITQKQKLTQKNKLFYPQCHVNKSSF